MAEHDPMCPMLGVGYEAATFCYCERLRERDARVRADERATTYARRLDRAEIIRADERERCAQRIEAHIVDNQHYKPWRSTLLLCAAIIRGGESDG